MKTPYDIDEAKRWFERAEKQARAAIAKVRTGDEPAIKAVRRERDKMSALLRWFYYDDRPYWEKADKADDEIRAALAEAIDVGYAARQEQRAAEIRATQEREREAETRLSPELRQYKRELRLSEGKR